MGQLVRRPGPEAAVSGPLPLVTADRARRPVTECELGRSLSALAGAYNAGYALVTCWTLAGSEASVSTRSGSGPGLDRSAPFLIGIPSWLKLVHTEYRRFSLRTLFGADGRCCHCKLPRPIGGRARVLRRLVRAQGRSLPCRLQYRTAQKPGRARSTICGRASGSRRCPGPTSRPSPSRPSGCR
jgi:hypothetical protein